MPQLRLAVLIVSICVCAAASATDTPKKVGSAELMQIVAASQTTPDADLAQKLAGIERLPRVRKVSPAKAA